MSFNTVCIFWKINLTKMDNLHPNICNNFVAGQ